MSAPTLADAAPASLASWNEGPTKKSITAFVDRVTKQGSLDKALDEAATRKWTVVDMKQDWKTIFPAPAR